VGSPAAAVDGRRKQGIQARPLAVLKIVQEEYGRSKAKPLNAPNASCCGTRGAGAGTGPGPNPQLGAESTNLDHSKPPNPGNNVRSHALLVCHFQW